MHKIERFLPVKDGQKAVDTIRKGVARHKMKPPEVFSIEYVGLDGKGRALVRVSAIHVEGILFAGIMIGLYIEHTGVYTK